MGKPVEPDLIHNSFCILKLTEVDGEMIPTPVNSQNKMDDVVLTLEDPQTGKFSINYPYVITNAVHLTKVIFYEEGKQETEEN